MRSGLLRAVDAVTVRMPDLDSGVAFYGEMLRHQLSWRNDELGQAGLRTPESATEIVLTTELGYEPNWLVESVEQAVSTIVEAGGSVVVEPFEIPVGLVAAVTDPFGNALVLIDLSKGRYHVDGDGQVTGVR